MAIGLRHDGETKILDFRDGVDGLEYGNQPNSVVWHDQNSTEEKRNSLLTMTPIPTKYLKWQDNDVVEMSQAEKDAVDAQEAADIVLQAKVLAKSLQDDMDAQFRLIRVTSKLNIDENNIIFQWLLDFKSAVNAATSLADLKTRVGSLPDTPTRTYQQARTAIENLIDNE